ncbi:MAG: dTMP kinase [Planctomycetota bacterium]
MFIVFDGIDGAGKTTQIESLARWLSSGGPDSREREVVVCKDPGSTQLGEQLRSMLLGIHETPIHMRSEMLMFTAARTQLVEQLIRPALSAGKTVVLDRYILSTVVYQGHAGELRPEDIWTVNRIATDDLLPDLTFVLDLPVEKAMQRLGESRDRMESRGEAYFGKVREGFLHEAGADEKGCTHLVDASKSVDEMQAEIRQIVARSC